MKIMKTITLCTAMLFMAWTSYGQKALTLTEKNVDVDPGKVKLHTPASISGVTLPATGTNKSWDYSKLKKGTTIKFRYFENKYKQFSKTAIFDTGHLEPFTPYEIYPTNQVFDESSNGYFFAGDYTPRNATGLGEVTTVTTDSLIITQQASLPTNTDYILKFPTTYNNSWSTTYTKTIYFTLTISALGFDKLQCSEVEHTTVTNSVVGWGGLKTPGSGKDDYDNALMIRRSVVTTDNIYFGSSLAPDAILASFGTAQGATTVNSNTESFYTEGDFIPALVFDFGADDTWSTLAGVTYRNDDEDHGYGAVVINKTNPYGNTVNPGDVLMNSSSLFVNDFTAFPNPVANGGNLNCRFTKSAPENWTMNVTNSIGQIVNTITVSGTGVMNIPVEMKNQNEGLFFVNLLNDKGEQAGSSKFMVGSK